MLYVISQFGELGVGVGVSVGTGVGVGVSVGNGVNVGVLVGNTPVGVGVGVGVGPNAFGTILNPPENCIPMVIINSLFL
jgi:hypothetical protein